MVIISIVSLVKLLFIVWKKAFTLESANLRVQERLLENMYTAREVSANRKMQVWQEK